MTQVSLPEAPPRALAIVSWSLPDPVPPVERKLVHQAPIFVFQSQSRHAPPPKVFLLVGSPTG
jgi:hypothetical protein